MIRICDDNMTALDIPTVQAFLLVADLESFTRTAEVLGTTQAAVSMKLQRLEAALRKRLVERSPRAARLTADGTALLAPARADPDARTPAPPSARPAARARRAGRRAAQAAPRRSPERALIEAHERALSPARPAAQQLSLGISDHAAGPELVPLMERLNAVAPQLALSVTTGFSRE